MKKFAIVIDFDPKIDIEMSSNMYDVFIIDRYQGIINNIVTSQVNQDINHLSMQAFYRQIRGDYQEIISLFISYQYTDIDDHLIAMSLNKERKSSEARIIPYLINYKNQNKQKILLSTLEMIEKEYQVKDIISRIHQFRKAETFSLSELMMQYKACLL